MTSNEEIYLSYLCDQIMVVCNRINKKLDVIDEQQRFFPYTDPYAPLQNPADEHDRRASAVRPPAQPPPLQYPAPAYVTPWQTTAEPYFDYQPPPPPPPPNTFQQHTYNQPTYLLNTEPYRQSLYSPYIDPYRQPKSQPYTDPWQQDQLVYRPLPRTESPPPPPQHSPSCWSPTNSYCQAVSGLEQSPALQQPLPQSPSPCWSQTSHCRPTAPLPAAAVVQPLNLPPPTAISQPCSPIISPAVFSDVVPATVVPSSMKEEISEGVKYQFGDCSSSSFGERKAIGTIHNFDDIFIQEGGQHKIVIGNVVAVAKIETASLILHVMKQDWMRNDQTKFKDIFDVDHFIQYLKMVSNGNYNWTERFFAIDP